MKRLIKLLVVLFPVACFVAGCGQGKPVPDKTAPSKVESDYAKEWTSRKMQPEGTPAPAAEKAAEKKN